MWSTAGVSGLIRLRVMEGEYIRRGYMSSNNEASRAQAYGNRGLPTAG